MTLTDAEHLAVLLAAVTFVATFGAVALVIARARRRWRNQRGIRGLLRRTMPAGGSALGGMLAATVGSPSWWLLQRERHGMWRSVAAAQRAVSVASKAQAPVGELPMLVRQLHQAAKGVDATLRAAGPDRRLARDASRERSRIEATAADIRATAVASLTSTTVDVEPVTSAVAVEVAALAEGLRSARSLRLPAR